MAVTATFKADFASFYDAVQKADVQLKNLDTGAGKVQSSLDRMVKSFSGQKIIGDAQLMTKAIGDIGNASKLTESEQRRVNATLSEAIAKYRALGQTAPADMLKLADATKQVSTSSSSLASGFTKLNGLLGAFGAAVSIGAVVNLGKTVLDTAGTIKDLSQQLGISTDAVQGFKFAAEQSGSSLDEVGTALTKMNANLAGGDKATVQALKDAGLSFDAIRAMRPEDAFLTIADAIAKIPDPMTQADVAMQLFGRNGAALLPAIKEGFRSTAEAANKMSQDTIDALDAAGDAWKKLADNVVIVSGRIIAASMNMVEGALGSWRKFGVFVDNALTMGIGPALALADAVSAATHAVESHARAQQTTVPAIHRSREALEEHTRAVKGQHEASQAAIPVILGLGSAFEGLGEKVKITIPDLIDWANVLPQVTSGIDDIAGKIGEKWNVSILSVTLPKMKESWGKALTDMFADSARFLGTGGGPFTALKQFGDTFAKDFTKTALSFIPAIGPLISQFAGPIVDGVKKFFGGLFGGGTAGRDLVKEFAGSMGGFDALHALLGEKLPNDSERLWIALTQGVGRNNPEQAKAAIEAITSALDAQAKKEAEAATATTAASMERQAAHQQALDAAQAAVKALDDQITSLQQSIANEAPEEVMGIVEAQTRAKIEGLQKEREEASKRLEELTLDMTDSMKDVAKAIRELPKDIEFHIKTVWDSSGQVPVPSGEVPETAAMGGLVGNGKILHFASGGPVTPWQPRGTDTVPAMLTPGELILNATQQTALARSLQRSNTPPQTIIIRVPVYLDGRQVAEITVPHIPDVVRRYGLVA